MFFRGQTIGKYRIVSALGSGGFGTVYLAEDTWIDKKVAIKVPHKQGVDFGDLLKEPRLLASMSHPNIVTVITAEKQDDVFFIVMEYVEGETLEERISRDGPLELSVALDFTCQICNAVDHAHAAGILHRDLRPGNILVSSTGLLKVTDFGTSRFLESAAHGTTVIGSPPYMAPEQFHGKAVFASDVYAIGVTVYQMLTGVLPVHHARPRRPRAPGARRDGVIAPAAQSEGAGRAGRHRDEGVGAGVVGALRARLGRAARRAGGPGGRTQAGVPRGRWRRAPRARRLSATSRPGCGRATMRRRRGSAGTAASRCTPGPTNARFAARPNRISSILPGPYYDR